MLIWIIISSLLVILDQGIKLLVINNLSLTDTFEFIPNIINFIYVKNTGAAFSMLSGKTFILGIFSLVVCIALIWYLIKHTPQDIFPLISLSLILGGAAGNLIDRLFRGFVVDYIELCFINFPVFNLADIGITVGAVLLMVYVIFIDGKKK